MPHSSPPWILFSSSCYFCSETVCIYFLGLKSFVYFYFWGFKGCLRSSLPIPCLIPTVLRAHGPAWSVSLSPSHQHARLLSPGVFHFVLFPSSLQPVFLEDLSFAGRVCGRPESTSPARLKASFSGQSLLLSCCPSHLSSLQTQGAVWSLLRESSCVKS